MKKDILKYTLLGIIIITVSACANSACAKRQNLDEYGVVKYKPSAEQEGAQFGVEGAIGSALTTFGLNLLSERTVDAKNQKYITAVASRTAELTQEAMRIEPIIQKIAWENRGNPDEYIKQIKIAKDKYISGRTPEQKQNTNILWTEISYSHWGEMRKRWVIDQKNQEYGELTKAVRTAEGKLIANAIADDPDAMNINYETFKVNNNALVLGGYKTKEQAIKDEQRVSGAMIVAPFLANGDYNGASTRIDVMLGNPDEAHLIKPARTYMEKKIAKGGRAVVPMGNKTDLEPNSIFNSNTPVEDEIDEFGGQPMQKMYKPYVRYNVVRDTRGASGGNN